MQVDIARKVAKGVENVLGVECEQISFENVWAQTPPTEANGSSLPEFINEVKAA